MIALPKRRRLPPSAEASTPNAAYRRYSGNSNSASSENWSAPLLSSSSGKLSATSCTHRTSKSASSRAVETMRARSTRPSRPRPHWMFQVMSFNSLGRWRYQGRQAYRRDLPVEVGGGRGGAARSHLRAACEELRRAGNGRRRLQHDGELALAERECLVEVRDRGRAALREAARE